MKDTRLFSLFVLLAIACLVVANDETLPESEQNDQSGDSATEIDQKLLELAKQEEDTEEWRRKFKKMSQELAKNISNQDIPVRNDKRYNRQSITQLQAAVRDDIFFGEVQTKLSAFSGPLSSRCKDSLKRLNRSCESLSTDDKLRALRTLSVISSNIEAYGNAGEDPISAMKAAINILASISSNFGPKSQLASKTPGFVPALLGLFGKGRKPKSLDAILVEEIDRLLAEKPKEDAFIRKGYDVLSAFKLTKACFNRAAQSGKPLSKKEVALGANELKRVQGVKFFGELASKISEMFKNNKAADARKTIRYCEMYAKLVLYRDIILTQYLCEMPTNDKKSSWQNHINGVLADRELFRRLAGAVLGKLYAVDYDSKIIPYFDPDVSVITDTYSTEMLNMGKYDRSMAGLHCLMTEVGNVPKDMIWQQWFDNYKVDGNPYIARRNHSNINCYWKLVPHGNNTYSIVNKRRCKEGDEYCGALLSWSPDGDEAFVGISSDDPVLWEITGKNLKAIKNKRGCGELQSEWCNYYLVLRNKPRNDNNHPLNLSVGQLVRAELSHSWEIRRAPIVT